MLAHCKVMECNSTVWPLQHIGVKASAFLLGASSVLMGMFDRTGCRRWTNKTGFNEVCSSWVKGLQFPPPLSPHSVTSHGKHFQAATLCSRSALCVGDGALQAETQPEEQPPQLALHFGKGYLVTNISIWFECLITLLHVPRELWLLLNS